MLSVDLEILFWKLLAVIKEIYVVVQCTHEITRRKILYRLLTKKDHGCLKWYHQSGRSASPFIKSVLNAFRLGQVNK